MRSRMPMAVVLAAVLASAILAARTLALTPIQGVSLLAALVLGAVLDAHLLSAHARRAAILARAHAAIRIAEERTAGRRLCLAVIESLACAIEAKTGFDLGHLSRVQTYAAAICEALNLDEESTQAVRAAALVHEIGRLGVPENLLVKPGTLTREERAKMRGYPVLGSRILASIPFPWPVADAVRHHQERYDGTGYPDGLKGEAIPLGARILGVADVYDSLVSPRAYRPQRSHEDALESIRSESGRQLDPTIVDAFIAVVGRVNQQLAARSRALVPGAAREIAYAAREVQALHELATSIGASLDLSETLDALAERVTAIVECSSCVFYLVDGDHLRSCAAYGVNATHFANSLTRIGTYITGRVASGGEPAIASYMLPDIMLAPSLEPWTTLRSTLVVPVRADSGIIGTINLYHIEPEAFGQDDVRVMSLVGEMAGRGVENARLFAQTKETAFTDVLTGLRNARYLRHFLDQEMNRARKNGHSMAVLGIDLDRFKPVNDTFGHERGDEVLRDIGQLFQCQLRNYDVVARYAGDEFVVVLPETSRDDAEIVAEKIKTAMDVYSAGMAAREPDFPHIGASVGIAIFPDDADTPESLLARADHRMYDTKRARRAA